MDGIQQTGFAASIFAEQANDFGGKLQLRFGNVSEIVETEFLEEHFLES